MPTTSISIAAPPERVIGLLRQAEVYPRWVVGTRRLVDVEDGWPVPGTSFVHEVGLGPIRVRDHTRLVSDDDRTIVLDARALPFGRARVELRVDGDGGAGSVVELTEEPVGGAVNYVPRVVLDPATRLRNDRSLARLRAIAEDRAS